MKNTQNFILIFLLVIGLDATSQERPFYKSYNWDRSPVYAIPSFDTVGIVTVKDEFIKEFIFEKNDNFIEYSIEHKVIWLNSDKQIELNNKIYLPFSGTSELLVNKARVITGDGKVIELDESKILTAEDEETKRTYKYFTFEGIEKGSFIEYYYVLKKYPEYKGNRVVMQTDHKKYNVNFELLSPPNLVFEFKSYNGLGTIVRDTNFTQKNRWVLSIDSIPALEKEDQAPYNAYKQFLIYKLDRNIGSGDYEISSYGKVSENVYRFLYDGSSKSENKELAKFIKSSNAMSFQDEKDRIRALEDYVKKTIFLVDADSDDLNDVTYILKNNIVSESGIVRLFARLFKQMDINAQLVLTCNRSLLKFDKKFEANNFLGEYLFYFPGIKSFMSASELSSRLGFPPPELTYNYGLFIKEVSLGDFNTGIGKVKFIEPVAYDKSFDIIRINVKFDSLDLTKTALKVEKSSGGYYAMFIQPYMHLFDEKTRNEVIESHIKYIGDDIEIIDSEVFNENAESFGILPFNVTANVTSDAYVEKAGKKYLFKIGKLIGPQVEMYKEKERILPLETQFNRDYHREITFNIPDGYQIKNLQDINIDNEYKKDGEILMKFVSSYEIEGNKVKVIADEYYKIIEVAPQIFDEYRKVINSAADFNKVTLILNPQ